MIAKKASISILVIIFLTSCNFIFNNNNAGIEEVNFGTKKTELLKIKSFPDNQTPRNIILVIGDGTGINHTTLARLAIGGPDYRLSLDQMPVTGLMLIHSLNDIYTDSAAAGTAWATGFKTKNRYLSMLPDKKNLKTLPDKLSEKGFMSGIVATSSVTHATPAAFYAHIDSRYKEIEIANQLLESPIKVALGGGKEFFDLDKVNAEHTLLLSKTE